MDGFKTELVTDQFDPSLDTGDGSFLDQAGFQELNTHDLDSEPEISTEDSDSTKEAKAPAAAADRIKAVPVLTTSASLGGSLADAHRAINDKKNELLNTRVTHFGITFSDGEHMTSLKSSIRNLSRNMYFPVPKTQKIFNSNLDRIRGNYHSLIDSAKNYIAYIEGKNKVQSPMGQLRLALTKEILEQSEKELNLFEMPSKTLFAQAKGEPNWDEFLYNARAERVVESDTTIKRAGIGETISDRNVSASRMAERYGMNDIIASSETVLIEDGNGNVVRANSMEDVAGRTMGDLMEYAKAEGINLKLSPDAIRQLYELQVFDMISGQADRHVGSYVPSYDVTGEKEFTITSLKVIDNDMSFGANLTSMAGQIQQKGLIDRRGRVSIPYLPRDFYDKVMAYTPEMAAYDQMDIRSRTEIDALGIRMTQTQEQLRDMVSLGQVKLLDTDKEWQQARDDIIKLQRQGVLAKSYLPVEML